MGGDFYYIFFKSDKGKSYKTCIYPHFGNYKRWASIIESNPDNSEIWLNNLNIKNGNLIDADSLFTIENINNIPKGEEAQKRIREARAVLNGR